MVIGGATRLCRGSSPYRVNRAASLATMPGIDDSFALPSDERTTWRQLAMAGACSFGAGELGGFLIKDSDGRLVADDKQIKCTATMFSN